MKLIIKGNPKEISDFVQNVQNQHKGKYYARNNQKIIDDFLAKNHFVRENYKPISHEWVTNSQNAE